MSTISERIAALKLQQVGDIPVGPRPPYGQAVNNSSANATTQRARPPPPPPPRSGVPARPDRSQTSSVPPGHDGIPSSRRAIGNQPAAPPPSARPTLPARPSAQRMPSEQPSPALPPRRPSAAPSSTIPDLTRRGSSDSQNSIATTRSTVSAMSNATSMTSQGERNRIRAPEFDPSALPVLPARRTQEQKEAAERKYNDVRPARPLRPSRSTPKIAQIQQGTTPPPPALPSRTTSSAVSDTSARDPLPPPRPRPSALSMGFGNGKSNNARPPPLGQRPGAATANDAPPPIPAASKPNLAALLASKPKPKPNGIVPAATSIDLGPVAITSYTQFSQILKSHRIVVSDFYADWCGPCREFAPDYERLSKEYSRSGQISFIKINTDHNPDIRDDYKIACWPTLIIFDNGVKVQEYQGAYEYGITSTVEELAEKAGINLSGPAPITQPSVASSYSNNNGSSGSCLICRDFSGPDNHASRFPRQSLPSQDVGWLAQQLTAPFPSLTDKARAIFTWLHHNIAYDTVAFFNNNVKPSTPQNTIATGLAVCEGYAGLFAAIAMKAGLEAIVVGGASKGFGHTQLTPGAPLPTFKTDHAWNAVKIDHGEWKLIDACWGAGNVDRAKGFTKHFSPIRFTQSNNDFGLDHFPEDTNRQYRTDGRVQSWEEFVRAEKNGSGVDLYNMAEEEGFSQTSFQPLTNPIVVAQQPGPTVRFAFQKACPHWDPVRHGKGPHYLYCLSLEKPGGGGSDLYAEFETNGEVWWCDVPVHALQSGTDAQVFALTSFANKDGRGLTKDEYLRKKGRTGWGGGGLCKWNIR